jgi:hypothetical protein
MAGGWMANVFDLKSWKPETLQVDIDRRDEGS